MKTLSHFIVHHILDERDYDPQEWQDILKDYEEAVEAYKTHLQNDSPKTVHWAMIERDLIVALERMQSTDSLEGARRNNQSKETKVCLQPAQRLTALACSKCTSLLDCCDRKNRHCSDCLLFNVESQGSCEEPGYGTKADNNACDRFKLNASKIKPKEPCIGIDVPRVLCEFPDCYSKETSCKTCPFK